MACRGDYREHGAVRICGVPDAFSGHLHFSNGERTGGVVRAASASTRKRSCEKFRGDIFPRRFHLRRHPGMEISDRKSRQMRQRWQENGARPKHDQRRERPHRAAKSRPDPFGLRGSLPPLAAEIRSSCFGRAGEGNQELCKTTCSTKPQRRNKEKAWQSSRHHPNSQSQ